MFSTVCALISFIFACIAAVAAWSATRTVVKLDAATDEVERGRRALKVAADRLSLLEARVDRLTGRVYAQSRKPPQRDPAPADDDTARGTDRSYAGVDQLDPELAAELALQSAPPVAPGRS